MYLSLFKRIIDLILSYLGLVLLSPIFIIVALIILINNKGNLFFLQKRPGKNEKIFSIIKFKTMNDKKDKYGKLLPDKLRLTKIGKFIRTTSLDEIPQLINVIKGDMSIVGPRPLLIEYLPLYSDFQKQRHNVKPGITGYAQVNGRNALKWKKKFELDIYYVKKISFTLDCEIVFKTIVKVFLRSDINKANATTMEVFKGNVNHE
ncbi:MAG: sugar transferase [Bacteroidetes bacterium]|nr:sugar transferase [Bacteroidota bacterium]